jgi:hypothetical protein
MASRNNNRNNPYNDESGLFKQLTRLFSGPLTQRRTQQVVSFVEDIWIFILLNLNQLRANNLKSLNTIQ